MSVVVGIHDGHNASVAVVRDGRVEFALQEERLTRIKNQGDAPAAAAAEARSFFADQDGLQVALNGRYMNYGQWERETVSRDYRRCSSLGSRLKQPFKDTLIDRVYQRRKAGIRRDWIEGMGFSGRPIEAVEHHLAHAAAAYYTSPWRGARTLVVTCDGSGDRLSATVNIGEGSQLRRIASVSEHDSLGRLYSLVTRYLGMQPLEHEYKVMGLAPYAAADPARLDRDARVFEDLFEFTSNPLVWRRRRGVPSMYSAYGFLERGLAGMRFDRIAAGIQRFLERMLARWVRNAVRETGICRVACSGGVFMNVKANLALLAIDEIEDLYVFPSCGDESNSIGAACRVAAQQAGGSPVPLGGLYFGDPITDQEAESAIRERSTGGALNARFVPDMEHHLAAELARGKIVARAKGRMEFGARALGNRSILARADSPTAVRAINESVKNRDFWMPFAPSVLGERAADYYLKPKPLASPYMMLAFPSLRPKRAALSAALHAQDFTARPQEVFEDHNRDYWRLLKEYESRTGEAVLLNTSFNLHGEPIVYRARDAVDAFLRTGLEYLALGNWWVEKRPSARGGAASAGVARS